SRKDTTTSRPSRRSSGLISSSGDRTYPASRVGAFTPLRLTAGAPKPKVHVKRNNFANERCQTGYGCSESLAERRSEQINSMHHSTPADLACGETLRLETCEGRRDMGCKLGFSYVTVTASLPGTQHSLKSREKKRHETYSRREEH
ncbi:unnamed protein product, partial [Phaeothamnion confervicola]